MGKEVPKVLAKLLHRNVTFVSILTSVRGKISKLSKISKRKEKKKVLEYLDTLSLFALISATIAHFQTPRGFAYNTGTRKSRWTPAVGITRWADSDSLETVAGAP